MYGYLVYIFDFTNFFSPSSGDIVYIDRRILEINFELEYLPETRISGFGSDLFYFIFWQVCILILFYNNHDNWRFPNIVGKTPKVAIFEKSCRIIAIKLLVTLVFQLIAENNPPCLLCKLVIFQKNCLICSSTINCSISGLSFSNELRWL